jgi:glycosyltransferase involved in cell wall biosynthesis
MNLVGQITTTLAGASRWPGLSVVVPVYKSEAILPDLVQRLSQALPSLAEEYELILVNDCSPDRSWDVICDLARQYSWIRPINLMRNYGQHNALLCGIRAARYDVIVTMDDDLQHPPEEIPKLREVLAGGYDVVYGTPEQEQHGLGRVPVARAYRLHERLGVGRPGEFHETPGITEIHGL